MSYEEAQMRDSVTLRLYDEHGKLKNTSEIKKKSYFREFLKAYKRWLLT